MSHPAPGHGASYTITVEGLNASYPAGPLTIDSLTLATPGGGTAADAAVEPPFSPLQYQPRFDGTRPSFGLFARFVRNLSVAASSIRLDADEADGRPAIVADRVSGLRLKALDVGGGGGVEAPCQLAARNCSGDWSDGGKLPSCEWRPAASVAETWGSHEVLSGD
mgnify:CR=1 FL=1